MGGVHLSKVKLVLLHLFNTPQCKHPTAPLAVGGWRSAVVNWAAGPRWNHGNCPRKKCKKKRRGKQATPALLSLPDHLPSPSAQAKGLESPRHLPTASYQVVFSPIPSSHIATKIANVFFSTSKSGNSQDTFPLSWPPTHKTPGHGTSFCQAARQIDDATPYPPPSSSSTKKRGCQGVWKFQGWVNPPPFSRNPGMTAALSLLTCRAHIEPSLPTYLPTYPAPYLSYPPPLIDGAAVLPARFSLGRDPSVFCRANQNPTDGRPAEVNSNSNSSSPQSPPGRIARDSKWRSRRGGR